MNTPFFARRFGRCLAALCLLSGLTIQAYAQSAPAATPVSGQALDQNRAPLPYASVGVIGQPVGTVADEQGRFRLSVPAQYDADSLRISLVGYRPYTVTVRDFRRRACQTETLCPVVLTAAAQTTLREVVVRPKGKAARKVLGNSGNSTSTSVGLEGNSLGNQIGQLIRIKYPSMLEQVSFHINQCTYDSVFYRVNVYRMGPDGLPDEQRSVLPKAVYVRLAKAQTADRIQVDLSRYQLWLEPEQHVAVCLELVRDLGPGKLYLTAKMLGGPVFGKNRDKSEDWKKMGGVGAGIDATVTEIR